MSGRVQGRAQGQEQGQGQQVPGLAEQAPVVRGQARGALQQAAPGTAAVAAPQRAVLAATASVCCSPGLAQVQGQAQELGLHP